MISSCVMARHSSAPLRSFRRNMVSPMLAQRPLSAHTSIGFSAGRCISWPMVSISSRTMATILLIARVPRKRCE